MFFAAVSRKFVTLSVEDHPRMLTAGRLLQALGALSEPRPAGSGCDELGSIGLLPFQMHHSFEMISLGKQIDQRKPRDPIKAE